jgi:hypothetical protein
LLAAGTGHSRQANPSDALASGLRGNHHQGLARRATASFAGAFSADERRVHLHRAGQTIPARPHHGPPQFVQPVPGGAVPAQTEDALHAQSAGSILLVGDVPQGFEPQPQRFVGVGEERARGDRNVALAILAAESAPLGLPELPTTALWANPSLWPTQLDEVVAAGVFGVKLIAKFQQVLRIVCHVRNLAKQLLASSA